MVDLVCRKGRIMSVNEGKKILLDAFWSSKGWKDGAVTQENFEIAKSQGYMFDYPKPSSHSASLEKLKQVVSAVDARDVANAFLYSLSTRALEYRSALGSYYYALAIPPHSLDVGNGLTGESHCYLCGWYAREENPNEYERVLGLNVFNFERYKWGGVRHTYLDYVLFDLEQFLKLPKVIPTDKDKEILTNVLKCVGELEPYNKAGKLRDLIVSRKILKCNKAEVGVILNILGICGILTNRDYPSYDKCFVDEYERDPVEMKNDFGYPVNRWRACDGVDYSRLEEIFNLKI